MNKGKRKKSLVGYMCVIGFYQLKFNIKASCPPRVECPDIFKKDTIWKRLKRKHCKVRITIEKLQ